MEPHRPHGNPCRLPCCHRRLPFSPQMSTFYDGPSTELQPPALQRSSRLMNHSVGQSLTHSLIPSESPACLARLLAISQLLPAWPIFHQLEERKEPSNSLTPATAPCCTYNNTVPHRTVLLQQCIVPQNRSGSSKGPPFTVFHRHGNTVWNSHRCPGTLSNSGFTRPAPPSSPTGNKRLPSNSPASQLDLTSNREHRSIVTLTALPKQAHGLEPKARGAV